MMECDVFERVTIVGVGLLGASLGLALKARGLARRIVGVGRKTSRSLEVARERGAIDEAAHEVAAGAGGGRGAIWWCCARRSGSFRR